MLSAVVAWSRTSNVYAISKSKRCLSSRRILYLHTSCILYVLHSYCECIPCNQPLQLIHRHCCAMHLQLNYEMGLYKKMEATNCTDKCTFKSVGWQLFHLHWHSIDRLMYSRSSSSSMQQPNMLSILVVVVCFCYYFLQNGWPSVDSSKKETLAATNN